MKERLKSELIDSGVQFKKKNSRTKSKFHGGAEVNIHPSSYKNYMNERERKREAVWYFGASYTVATEWHLIFYTIFYFAESKIITNALLIRNDPHTQMTNCNSRRHSKVSR